MRGRSNAIVLSAMLAALAATPALSQTVSPEPPRPVEPPRDLPRVQRGQNLDKLFEALKVAPDEASAKYIENRIWAAWHASNSDTATLLMSRVKIAVDAKEIDLAIRLLSSIIAIKPDYVEAWNQRATLYYMKKDFSSSLADIHNVLAREPRHFGALSGLGMIMQEFGDDKGALEAFRRALALHPRLERIPDLVKKLGDKVDGRAI